MVRHLSTKPGTTPQCCFVNTEGNVNFSGTRSLLNPMEIGGSGGAIYLPNLVPHHSAWSIQGNVNFSGTRSLLNPIEIEGSGGAIYLPDLVPHHSAWSIQKGT